MQTKTKIVLASGNQGKLKELREMLASLGLEILSQADFNIPPAEETAPTFVENALLKARHVSRETGLPAIADDSGLSVDTLDGAPGIFSARYAGEHGDDAANNAKLLEDLKGVPELERSASFRCALVLVRHPNDPVPIICEGIWNGRILIEPRGENGFGYDPLFYVPEMECASAELDKETKNRLSHRGKAMQLLIQHLT
ncbi:MAG: RdgB/HAM1 family non-canonical purine NTP pyrophosphatase [Gammaproteobacteria bacterium]|nr:RdgB/HAM1 family non-canonical purine NTP pyrophosphatase [Gammaproteobacteria bacterium]NNC97944.1 RdgB/HAM1 family non-canonical purine NTP pyrophosphatase [Gammaproteobacteria bacterium]NNM14258.1 RdgB/HAM1 family non-canonical purine NTP pyrophosphatase [Gammaproteobacteria bacterium]